MQLFAYLVKNKLSGFTGSCERTDIRLEKKEIAEIVN